MTFKKATLIALISVYLVIIAGAVVRMTGSGMGCPDWPKCFGYYIPPTEVETIEWQADRAYESGQVIIWKKGLLVANTNFTTTTRFNTKNWTQYTKHDYARFNVWHTWIEYINRLLGAIAGFATLLLAIYSLWQWKKRKRISIIAWLVVFGMGFQAWLGATVVYSVLEPVKITIHLVMALVIVALLIYLLHEASTKKEPKTLPANIHTLFIAALVLSLVQIVLGTQVRQFVDTQIDVFGEQAKSQWLKNPALQFYIHRSLSILVVALNGYLWWFTKKYRFEFSYYKWIMALILLEALTGISMYYFDFPFGSQPLHLVWACLLFGLQFYLVLRVLYIRKERKTLYL